MPTTGNQTIDIVLYCVVGGVLAFAGYRLGRLVSALASTKTIAAKEQELFTAQKSFKTLYEQELAALKGDNEQLQQKIAALEARVEDYRKKAAGFGGLFSNSSKRADAMYALLLENEALEEALYAQNEKLKAERTDALKEQMRATGYRRILISQLMNDERIKSYVAEIMADEKRLPSVDRPPTPALPAEPQPGAAATP